MVADPVEDACRRYEAATCDLEAAWKTLDSFRFSDSTPTGLAKNHSIDDFNKALAVVDERQKAMFRAYDAWQRFIELQRPTPVDSEAVEQIVADTLNYAEEGNLVIDAWAAIVTIILQHAREEEQHAPVCGTCD